MNSTDYKRTAWNTPFIAQRADPYVLHCGGQWYFTASVPEYDRIALRRADALEGLREAPETVVWRAHATGPMSQHIWAPELHRLDGRWYLYFAAGEKEDVWKIRPWVLCCEGDDPLADPWTECGMLTRADGDDFSFTDFSLDMTVFEHRGRRFCVWAEKVSVGRKISNLYIAEMADPLTLKTPQMLLSSPSYAWERHEFWVNEGPAFVARGGRVYLTFSASDTGPAYCMGLLWADADADLMDIAAWHKLNRPVYGTDAERGLFGPGHNTFFTDTFQDLFGMNQLPGIAAQNLMARGVGFGPEGDYKISAFSAVLMKMAEGREGATGFIEDYTYDLTPGHELELASHMLEVPASFAATRPKIQVHPLGIGDDTTDADLRKR